MRYYFNTILLLILYTTAVLFSHFLIFFYEKEKHKKMAEKGETGYKKSPPEIPEGGFKKLPRLVLSSHADHPPGSRNHASSLSTRRNSLFCKVANDTLGASSHNASCDNKPLRLRG